MTSSAGTVAAAATVPGVDTAARLERVAGRLMRRLRAAHADGLSPSQWSLLRTVREYGPLSLADIADREAVRAPTASRGVDALVQQGLLRRAIDPDDGRRHLIDLTDTAATLLERGAGGVITALSAAVSGLDRADRNAVELALPALERLVSNLPER